MEDFEISASITIVIKKSNQSKNEYHRNYRRMHPEYSKLYYEFHRDKLLEYARQRCQTEKDKDVDKREYRKNYYQCHREKLLEYGRKYRQAKKPEQMKDCVKKQYQTKKQKLVDYCKKYYERNKENRKDYVREYQKNYYQLNKERIKEQNKPNRTKIIKCELCESQIQHRNLHRHQQRKFCQEQKKKLTTIINEPTTNESNNL